MRLCETAPFLASIATKLAETTVNFFSTTISTKKVLSQSFEIKKLIQPLILMKMITNRSNQNLFTKRSSARSQTRLDQRLQSERPIIRNFCRKCPTYPIFLLCLTWQNLKLVRNFILYRVFEIFFILDEDMRTVKELMGATNPLDTQLAEIRLSTDDEGTEL